MKEFAVRLSKGADLKDSIESICRKEGFNTAVVLSSVGSLNRVHLRLAKAHNYFEREEGYEILSLNGTISNGDAHLHMAVSNEFGAVVGGHLKNGCIVESTCELVLGVLENYTSSREEDQSTGYKEIVFKAA